MTWLVEALIALWQTPGANPRFIIAACKHCTTTISIFTASVVTHAMSIRMRNGFKREQDTMGKENVIILSGDCPGQKNCC